MKEKTPLISVLLNVYNGEREIFEQIRSILEQTYSNFELIIIDDGSKDETCKVINNLKDKRIKLYINPKNIGLSKSFKKGLKFCHGEYITISDHDNSWLPNRLQEQIDCFNKYPKSLLVFHDCYLTDENLNITSNSFHKDFKGKLLSFNKIDTDSLGLKNLLENNIVPGLCLMFHRSLLKYALQLPPTMLHDHWLALNAANISNIRYIDKPLVKYRQHHNCMVGALNKRNSFYIKGLFSKKIIQDYKIDRQKYVDNLKILKKITSPNNHNIKLITIQIKLIENLIQLIESKNISQLFKRINLNFDFCLKNKRERYFKYIIFISLNRLITNFSN